MDAFRHVLIAVVLALVFAWLWRSASIQKAKLEPGRTIFPPARAIKILAAVFAIAIVALIIWTSYIARKPDEWWVPYAFLGFLVLVPLMYPPVLSIEVEGIGSRYWFGREKKIRWEDVASLHFNTGNKMFVVRDRLGGKIAHSGFNADPELFRQEIQKRTRLPLKVARPGTWKTETVEVPYEETKN
jgi:Bacterial PH domain